jgi:hypothetical protein
VGHSSKHFPAFSHFAGSIFARFDDTATAAFGQAFTHFMQPMHPDEQTFAVTAPGSFELHFT